MKLIEIEVYHWPLNKINAVCEYYNAWFDIDRMTIVLMEIYPKPITVFKDKDYKEDQKMRHDFVRTHMSFASTIELWECMRCDVTAISNWNDKTGSREEQKINGPESCQKWWCWFVGQLINYQEDHN